jgi:sugar lactone lactonase YvrE
VERRGVESVRADHSTAKLACVLPDGTARVAAEGMHFPNGPVITPDGKTLIVGETVAARYTQFAIAEDGSLGERAVWSQIEPEPTFETFERTLAELRFAPDGCALDAEGCIWSADAVGGRVARLAPGGEIVEVVHGPEGLGVFACMLGGEDGRTLLICAAPDFLEHLRMDKREAVLLTTTVDVPHAGLP